VNVHDRAYATCAIGVLALWMGLTDAMLKYLRPSMRPWLVAAGAGLVAVSLYGMFRAQRMAHDGHDHGEHSRVAWLLVAPVVAIILFGPQAMGEFAVGRTPNLPPYAFDIAAYASSTNQKQPRLKVLQVLDGARERGNRAYLSAHDVVVEGFVSVVGPRGPRSFVLTRYLMSCCAADAQPLNLTMVEARAVPAKGEWVAVTARLVPTAHAGKYGPVMTAKRVQAVPTPSAQYESLR
jgi:uncharacterized repeat protein (TIGR03943 family)